MEGLSKKKKGCVDMDSRVVIVGHEGNKGTNGNGKNVKKSKKEGKEGRKKEELNH